jgi:CRISPR-associated endoribonuclease Cas6|nr:MAG: CRISPR-associated endoribonuclease [Bacteroidota bacterium]
MRLRIALRPLQGSVLLPWHYPVQLQALVYRWISAANAQLARKLHDQGFAYASRRYKLFVYSLLYGGQSRAERAGIRMEGQLSFWIASPMRELVEAVAAGLLQRSEVELGEVLLQVEQVLVEPSPNFSGPRVRMQTLSPLVVSTGLQQGGRLEKRFLDPSEPDFSRVLGENLRRKAALLGIPEGEGEVRLEPLRMRSRLFRVHGTNVRAWEGQFYLQAPVELLQVGYEAGLGERNGQGFGMVRLLLDGPPGRRTRSVG